MKKISLLCLLLLGGFIVQAQQPIRIAPDAIGNYSVIAFMVDFQPDTDTLTFGNGKFNSAVRDTGFLDSYPRNFSYFENHLQFLKNYWEGVSKNKVNLTTHLINQIITLPQSMSYYSSFKQDADTAYKRLIQDFVTAAKQQVSNLTTEINNHFISKEKTHFILFHAGLGHDINWVSIFGYDPTPKDMSSIYLGEGKIKNYFENLPNLTNNVLLGNLSILPETLTRPIEAYGQKAYLNFGINGLMVANMGNFFGLPDLYHSKTGSSMIGAFGLMDGFGFFNYNGFLPSAPSVWEKYQLGWVKPNTYQVADLPKVVSLISDHGKNNFDSTAVFVYLGSSRYYLLENKMRENSNNREGLTIYYEDEGSKQKHFPKDVNEFYTYNQSGVKGVITGLSNYDWSFPAGVNEKKDTISGGVLIWRLNDQVLLDRISSNSLSGLNDEPNNPMLKLIEADGSYDIGKNYGSMQAASGAENGTIFDYFYLGNIAPLYKNKFSPDTRPTSDWEYNIPTYLSISGFARPALRQNLTIEYEQPLSPLSIEKFSIQSDHNVTAADYFKINSKDYVFIFSEDSTRILKNKEQIFSFDFKVLKNSNFRNYSLTQTQDTIIFVGVNFTAHNSFYNQMVRLTVFPNGTIQKSETTVNDFKLLDDIQVTENGFVRIYRQSTDNDSKIRADVVDYSGTVHSILNYNIPEISGNSFETTILPDNDLTKIVLALNIFSKNQFVLVSSSGVIVKDGIYEKLLSNPNNTNSQLLGLNHSKVTRIDKEIGNIISEYDITHNPTSILLNNENYFYTFSRENNQLNAFENKLQLNEFPLVAIDSILDVRLLSLNNLDCVLYQSGTNWFVKPLFVSDKLQYVPLSYNLSHFNFSANSDCITTTSIQSNNIVECLTFYASPIWGDKFSAVGYLNNQISHLTGSQLLFNQTFNSSAETAYVWPNPIKESYGNFRINLPFDGSGQIIIHNLTGQVIKTIPISLQKNQESEFRWEIGTAQSGLYLATINVSGSSKSFSKVIKVLIQR